MKRFLVLFKVIAIGLLMLVLSSCPQNIEEPPPPPKKEEPVNPIPQNLTVLIEDSNSIMFSWDEVKTAEKYIISRATVITPEADANFEDIAEVAAGQNKFNNINLANMTSYYYRICSVIDGKRGEWSTILESKTTGLGRPTNFRKDSYTSNSVQFSWAESKGATEYHIYRAIGAPKGFDKLPDATTDCKYVDNSITFEPGITYYYMVKAVNTSVSPPVESSFSTREEVMVGTNIPVNFMVNSNTKYSIELQWEAVKSATPVTYNIYRSTSKGSGYTKLTSFTNRISYINQGLTPATKYYYKISTTIDGKTSNLSLPLEGITQPPTPDLLQVNETTNSSILLTWDYSKAADRTNVLGYFIYRISSEDLAGGTGDKIDLSAPFITVSASSNKIVNISPLSAGTAYQLIVRSYILSDNNEYVISEIPQTPFVDFTKLAKVENLSSPKQTQNTVTLNWLKNIDATDYEIHRSTTSSFSESTVVPVAGSTTESVVDVGLRDFTKYFYKIYAIKKNIYNGQHATSMEIDQPLEVFTNMACPEIVTPVLRTDKGVSLEFNKVRGAEKYQLYRATTKNGTYAKVGPEILDNSPLPILPASDDTATPYTQYFYKVQATYLDPISGKTIVSDDPLNPLDAHTRLVKPTLKIPTSKQIGDDWVKLSWNTIEKPTTGFDADLEIYRSEDEKTLGTVIKIITDPVTYTSYTDTTVNASRVYYYTIRVLDKKTNKDYHSPYSENLAVATKMAAVTGLAIDTSQLVTTNSAKVKWNTHPAADKYIITVYNSSSSTTPIVTEVVNAPETSIVLSGLTVGDKHKVVIVAQSTVTSPVTESGEASIDIYTCPGVPTITKVKPDEDTDRGHLDITWSFDTNKGNKSLVSYEVRRVTSPTTSDLVATDIAGTTLLTTDNADALTNLTDYTYIVRAFIKVGGTEKSTSVFSSSADATATGKTGLSTPVLNQPTYSNPTISLSWPQVTGATQYIIYRRIGDSGSFTELKTVNTNTGSDVKSISKNYHYKIEAIAPGYTSLKSDSKNVLIE